MFSLLASFHVIQVLQHFGAELIVRSYAES
jgi:hypothetical protein